jgi:pimeloyl-ACP methyl ester carboxylesterase
MGALSALLVAGRYPALPRAVALEDPPPDWARSRVPPGNRDWLAHNRAWIAGLQQQTREAIVAAKHLESPTWPLEELGPWADSKLRFNPAYFEHAQPPQLDGQALLGRITCAVLLITAEPGLGAIVSDEQAAAFGAAVPQARRAHIPGAGHNVRRDQFAAYMAAVGEQLQAWKASD